MQDGMVPRPDTAMGSIGFGQAGDPSIRLEPLAVPFGRMGAILRRHVWVVLLSVVLGVGGTITFVKLMPKQYTAQSVILIEPQRTQVSDLQAISPDPGDVSSLIRTQMDILGSSALQMGVVKALHLTSNPEFVPKTGGLHSLVSKLLQKLRLASVTPTQPHAQDAVETAAMILGGKVGFRNETRSSVLNVLVTTHDPVLSARIANEIAKQFLDFKREEKFVAMQRAHDWFQEQLGKLSEQVRAAETKVEVYRQQHGLSEEPPDQTASRGMTVNRQQLDAVSGMLIDVSRQRALKEAQLEQAELVLHGKVPASTLPEVLVSPLIAELQTQAAAVAGREAQLETSEGRGNPELTATRAQLRRLQMRMGLVMNNIASSLTAEVNASRAQERALQQRLEQLRRAVSTENSAEVGLQALLTKARATRSIYESFLNRATQLANVSGIQEPDASLVSSARPPLNPSTPGGSRLLLVAAILSMALGVGLACFIERLRSGFSSPEQLEVHLGLPLAAVVPTVPRRAIRRGLRTRSAMAFTASLNKLRGQMRVLGEGRPRLVMVTSALPHEGKTVFAAGLAGNAAAAGWRVLLIECDFGHPSVADHFGLRSAPGLQEMLIGSMIGDRKRAIREVEPCLHVIPAGDRAGDPQELLASDRMTQLLGAVRERYDLIILDTPPVLPVADALVLAHQADATLMVVRWEKTARAAVQDAVRLLYDSRARLMGTVMTRVDLRTAALSGGRVSYLYNYYDSYHLPRTART
jgi:succinoglycan biosynthesis transport protein ExoP